MDQTYWCPLSLHLGACSSRQHWLGLHRQRWAGKRTSSRRHWELRSFVAWGLCLEYRIWSWAWGGVLRCQAQPKLASMMTWQSDRYSHWHSTGSHQHQHIYLQGFSIIFYSYCTHLLFSVFTSWPLVYTPCSRVFEYPPCIMFFEFLEEGSRVL